MEECNYTCANCREPIADISTGYACGDCCLVAFCSKQCGGPHDCHGDQWWRQLGLERNEAVGRVFSPTEPVEGLVFQGTLRAKWQAPVIGLTQRMNAFDDIRRWAEKGQWSKVEDAKRVARALRRKGLGIFNRDKKAFYEQIEQFAMERLKKRPSNLDEENY